MKKSDLSHAIDAHPDLKAWAPLAISIGRRTANLVYFRFREDWRQAVIEVSLEAARSGVDPYGGTETVRLLGRLWRQKMREYGFSMRYDVEGETIGGWYNPEQAFSLRETAGVAAGQIRKERPRCGVPLCTASGVYKNDRFGRLCRRHEMLVRMRRNRGWSDPYEAIETAGIKISETYVPPDSKNKKFWGALRLKTPASDWVAMWEWAKGLRKNIDPAILAKARAAIEGCRCSQ